VIDAARNNDLSAERFDEFAELSMNSLRGIFDLTPGSDTRQQIYRMAAEGLQELNNVIAQGKENSEAGRKRHRALQDFVREAEGDVTRTSWRSWSKAATQSFGTGSSQVFSGCFSVELTPQL